MPTLRAAYAAAPAETHPPMDQLEGSGPPEPGESSFADKQALRLGFLIHDVSRMRRRAYDYLMRPLGMTRARWWVLAYLSRHDGMTQTQLADILEVGRASLGNFLEDLEREGRIERRPDAGDKRVKRVYLTRAAQQLVKQMRAMEDEFNVQVVADLTLPELAQLCLSMQKIKHTLSRLNAPAAEDRTI